MPRCAILAALFALLLPLSADAGRAHDEYRKRRARVGTSVSRNFNLALWCRRHRLKTEMIYHLRRVLQLDDDHGFAQRMLDRALGRRTQKKASTPTGISIHCNERRPGRRVVQVGIAQDQTTGARFGKGRERHVKVGLDQRSTVGARFGQGKDRRYRVGYDQDETRGVRYRKGRSRRVYVGIR